MRERGDRPTVVGRRPDHGRAVATDDAAEASGDRTTRRYDSPVRRERTAATRDRIVASGVDLLRGHPVWKWSALTVPAVAERAGVSERTVYRHFASERGLREAVLTALEEEADVSMAGLALDGIADVTERILRHVATFPIEPRTERDETVSAANARQREALVAAVAGAAPEWSDAERAVAAAVLDVLWSGAAYDRLATDWGFDVDRAVDATRWAIGLVARAVRDDARPTGDR